jgi:hypothetical protein
MRECYARGEFLREDGMGATAGIEVREGDDVEELGFNIRVTCGHALFRWGGNHIEVARHIEEWIKSTHPGRAFFVETDEEGLGVQVFDPRDFVKERCTCACANR